MAGDQLGERGPVTGPRRDDETGVADAAVERGREGSHRYIVPIGVREVTQPTRVHLDNPGTSVRHYTVEAK